MPNYWEYLYKPRKEGQSETDKLSRRLSFKLPVVLRYNCIFAFFFGVLAAFSTRKVSTVFYFYRWVPLGCAALCYEEIIKYYKIVNNNPLEAEPKNTTIIDLIREQEKIV